MAEDNIQIDRPGLIGGVIRFFLEQKLIVILMLIILAGAGIAFAPFDWDLGWFPRDPVPVDAIPDIGENQQIVFTKWMGRSPQDVEDQITYPLTVSLLGIPGVKTVRSSSMFGFSSIYVIFEEKVDFYWSRSRILERLNSLPAGSLPAGVRPALGPDCTALGQVFWYTLEGYDETGRPTGGWDLDELRSIQDWQVRYSLLAVKGVSEVASVGGFEREYQVDIDPDAMRSYGVTLEDIFQAVRMSNVDVGARTIEINRVEYVLRGIGFIKELSDIENTVVKVRDNVPIYVKNVAHVSLGPALRRGALDKEGTEAVGGVVVVRYGENPLATIKRLKEKINEIEPSLPRKTLPDGRVSQVKIIPFYDRSGLIYETLDTLNRALTEEILITIIVVVVMLMHLRSSALISGLLPLAVLMCFIGMKIFKVDANIVALSGIAIAIGTIVDMGIVVSENILKHFRRWRETNGEDAALEREDSLAIVYKATSEVGSAVITAIATTVVSFLPVFTMIAAEGKLFKPLAYTKTFALLGSVIIALTILPAFAHMLFTGKTRASGKPGRLINGLVVLLVALVLTGHWMPLGPERGMVRNFIFAGLVITLTLGFFRLFEKVYGPMLKWFLKRKVVFMILTLFILLWGAAVWSGLGREFMPPLDEGSFLYMPTTSAHASIGEALDVIAKQDMAIRAIPEVDSVVGKIGRAETPLDPAPISMIETVINYKPEYTVDENGNRIRQWRPEIRTPDDIWKEISKAASIPGTTGASRLQPIKARIVMLQSGMRAPMGIKVKGPDLKTIEKVGLDIERLLKTGAVPSIDTDLVIADRIVGKAYLELDWDRKALDRYGIHIRRAQDVVEIAIGGKRLTTTVEGRERYPVRVRYQRELRDTIESLGKILVTAADGTQIPVGQLLESQVEINLRKDSEANAHAVAATIRGALLNAGIDEDDFQIGKEIPFPICVRKASEFNAKVGRLEGVQPELLEFSYPRAPWYRRGPMAIKSEDTKLVGYVLFDMKPGHAEVDVVEAARDYLESQEKTFNDAYQKAVAQGKSTDSLPGLNRRGCTYEFAGNYENQVRSQKTLTIVLPLALFIIFMILYFQFRSVATTLMVFSGILIAWAGGFILIGLYSQPWFLNFSIFGVNMQDLFQVHPINLSVAVWVGFLALFGIASDNGVIVATYLDQSFARTKPTTVEAIHEATLTAALRRIRPCLMTTATTVLALIPILTSTGRGSDVMVPMAIPSFGGMTVAVITALAVPILYCAVEEIKLKLRRK